MMYLMTRSQKFIVSVLLLVVFTAGLLIPPASVVQVSAEGGLPDLTVDGIAVPEAVVAGQQVSVTAAIYNAGDSDAAGFSVTFAVYTDADCLHEVPGSSRIQTVASLPAPQLPEDKQEVIFDWTPAVPGAYTLKVEADSGNAIAEADDTNNSATLTVEVKGKKELGEEVSLIGGRIFYFQEGIVVDLGGNIVPDNATLILTDVTGQPDYAPPGVSSLSPGGKFIDFDFKNIVFTEPVSVSIPVSDEEASSRSSIYHFNETDDIWEYRPSTYSGGVLTASVSSFSVYGVLTDTQAPDQCDITLISNSSGQVALRLTASDASGIRKYEIYRDGGKIGETGDSQYVDTSAAEGSTCTYKMKAVDNLGNTSDFSNELTVTVSKRQSGGVDKNKRVTIRIEGYDRTLVPQTSVTTDNFDLTPYLGRASGSSATPSIGWGPDRLTEATVAHATVRALEDAGFNATDHVRGLDFQDYGWSLYIAMIAGDREFDHRSTSGWMYQVNGWMPNYGSQAYNLQGGEDIVWYFGVYGFDTWFTVMNADKMGAKTGEKVTFTLRGIKTDYSASSGEGSTKEGNVAGAQIYVNGEEYLKGGQKLVTDADGKAEITFYSPGTYTISAERFSGENLRDIVRPHPVTVTVGGEALKSPQEAAQEILDALKEEKPDEKKVADAVIKAVDSLKAGADKAETPEDAELFLESASAIAGTLEKAAGVAVSAEIADQMAASFIKILDVLSGMVDKIKESGGKKTAGDTALKTVAAMEQVMEKISDRGRLEELTTGLIGSSAVIVKILEEQDINKLREDIDEMVQKTFLRISSETLPEKSLKREGNGIKAVLDALMLENMAEITVRAVKNFEEKLTQGGFKNNVPLKKEIVVHAGARGEKSVEAVLPAGLVEKLGTRGIERLEIVTPSASFGITPQTFGESAKDKEISLTASRLDRVQMPSAAEVPGGSAVVSLEAKVGEREGASFARPMEVRIPHEGIVQNADSVTVFLLKEDGATEPVGGAYEPENKKVRFLADHFSSYFVKESIKVFEDMADYSWARNPVEVLAGKGIIKGKSENLFDPGADVSRAEFAALVTRMLKYKAEETADLPFADVPKESWYYGSVAAAYSMGMIHGVSSDAFNPGGSITRQEMTKIIAGVLEKRGYRQGTVTQPDAFKDKGGIAAWAEEAAALVVKEGTVPGRGNDSSAPGEKVNRAETAAILHRLYKLVMP